MPDKTNTSLAQRKKHVLLCLLLYLAAGVCVKRSNRLCDRHLDHRNM